MHDPKYMARCLDLAVLGLGKVSPNPLVGAVLVHDDRIIGEGWHRQYGQAHAEVNAIHDAISNGFESLLAASTLYVNLEPCNHQGKTPPCADIILEKKIPAVVIGMGDPNPRVKGGGVKKLQDQGVRVEECMEEESLQLNRRFVTFVEKQRPYFIIKFAQSLDSFLAPLEQGKEIHRISGPAAHRLVHRWRTEEDAVMVGYNTARLDNPRLTVRHWTGRNPVRISVDSDLSLPSTLHLFDGAVPTLIFNFLKDERKENLEWIRVDAAHSLPEQVGRALYKRNVQSVILEGGLRLIQEFVNEGCWDEARIFTSAQPLGKGISAPFIEGQLLAQEFVGQDILRLYKNAMPSTNAN